MNFIAFKVLLCLIHLQNKIHIENLWMKTLNVLLLFWISFAPNQKSQQQPFLWNKTPKILKISQMTKSSVNVDGLKRASKKDFNQPILVFWKFFFQTCYPKNYLQCQWQIHPNLVHVFYFFSIHRSINFVNGLLCQNRRYVTTRHAQIWYMYISILDP